MEEKSCPKLNSDQPVYHRLTEPSLESLNRRFGGYPTYSGDEPPKADNVKHPAHYTVGKIEVWDFIVDQGMNYLEGNIIKYTARYKQKGGVEDLKKARAYLDKLIEGLERI